MGSALNGIALHGGTRPYGGTFLVFSDYMRGAVRLAALMKLPVIYVWTHDSIGLGGDGPTHQPVEHLAALRAIPGLDVVRPADANETVIAWRTALEQHDRPGRLGAVPPERADHRPQRVRHRRGRRQGGLRAGRGGQRHPEVIIIATGSEVSLALAARETLEAEGTPTRVVSMPCQEWFLAQDPSYQQTVLPPAVKARVSVEAAVVLGLAGLRRRRRREPFGRALRSQRPVRHPLRAVRHHPGAHRRRGTLEPFQGRRHQRLHHR